MASSLWKFRPSALTSAANAYTASFPRDDLTSNYETDNERANEEGVQILPRTRTNKSSLRTLQWNINQGWHSQFLYSAATIQKALIDSIQDADADVVVLNEYCSGKYTQLETFEKDLKGLGYATIICATVAYPTCVVTRLKVKEQHEFLLSDDRSALLIRVETGDGSFVWVIGTHLNHVCGKGRKEEIQTLLKALDKMGGILCRTNHDKEGKERVLLLGDLNQQRSQDYAPKEWERIRSGMENRGTCHDDGVATLLTGRGLACAWDATLPPEDESEFSDGNSRHSFLGDVPKINWDTSHPPATHWSGTLVDYSYYGGTISPIAVSISPAGWSDHRMTVCDWTW